MGHHLYTEGSENRKDLNQPHTHKTTKTRCDQAANKIATKSKAYAEKLHGKKHITKISCFSSPGPPGP
jgi:hypothetical protein